MRDASTATFSWGRAFKHAALPVAAVAIAGVVLATSGMIGAPEHAGEQVGRAIGAVLPIALFVSYFAQTGRTTAAWAVGIGVPVVLAVAAIAGLVKGVAVPALTAPERAAPTRVGGRLVQPAIGYSLPDPGGGFGPVDVSAQTSSAPLDHDHETMAAFSDPTTKTGFAIAIAKGEGATEASFTEFVDQMVHGLQGDNPAKLAAKTITWDGHRGTARIELEAHGVHFTVAAHAFLSPARIPFVVAIMIPGALPPALTALLDDFQITS